MTVEWSELSTARQNGTECILIWKHCMAFVISQSSYLDEAHSISGEVHREFGVFVDCFFLQ